MPLLLGILYYRWDFILALVSSILLYDWASSILIVHNLNLHSCLGLTFRIGLCLHL